LSERSRCYFFRQRSAIASPLVNSVSQRIPILARILLLFINPAAVSRRLILPAHGVAIKRANLGRARSDSRIFRLVDQSAPRPVGNIVDPGAIAKDDIAGERKREKGVQVHGEVF